MSKVIARRLAGTAGINLHKATVRAVAPPRAGRKMTKFDPKVHGFKFVNTFDNHRFFGPIHINMRGRCGGMVYSALDYFYNNTKIPQDTSLPIEGSVLSTCISARQERSTLNTIDRWVELSFNPFGWRTSEFFHWGIQETGGGRLQQLKDEINHGRPAVLGMLNRNNEGPGVGHHQILAIGYEGSGKDVKIFVYDPNYPNQTKVLRPHPEEYCYYYDDFNPKKDDKWMTYFVDLNYRVAKPCNTKEPASGPNLSGQNLSGQNLSNRDFRRAMCNGTNFTGCTINQGDFDCAKMERAIFHGANLRNSNFSRANLNRANFYGADLKDTRFLGSYIRNGCFIGADLKLSDMSGANLELCDFHGADLHRAKLDKCDCDSASFYGASLNSASLVGAKLRKANLRGADLRNANLTDADLTGADLTGANLSGATKKGTIGL
jgi:uncharacterized protein YjbI with pentapeptide repeats